jgi:hypothetical protein
MDDSKEQLEIIIGLMDELKEKMAYGEDDLSERLGRKKPEVEVMKMEVEADPMGGEMEEEEDDEEMIASEESPEEKLKKRLMKLRS